MSGDSSIHGYVLDTQIEIFDAARKELQIPLKVIAFRSGIPYPTLASYAEGRHAMSIAAIKQLLRVDGMAALLSRLFDPEEYCLLHTPSTGEIDHDTLCDDARDYVATKIKSHRADSPAGPAICTIHELPELDAKAARLRA